MASWAVRVAAIFALALSACTFTITTEGTFTCDNDRGCPDGTHCVSDHCVATEAADASPADDGDPASCSYAAAVLADTPVQYLRLDEAGGTVAGDSSGGGHDGTLLGATSHVPGGLSHEPGQGLELDGLTEVETYIEFSDAPASWASDFTLEALVRPLSPGEYGGLFVSETYMVAGFRITLDAAGDVEVVCDQSGCNTPRFEGPALTYQVWQHLAVVYSDHTFRVYLDGVDRGAVTFPDYVPGDPGGRWGPAGGLPMNVQLDEVALYDHALSAERIAEHHRRFQEGPSCP
jgi:hypothetical protein